MSNKYRHQWMTATSNSTENFMNFNILLAVTVQNLENIFERYLSVWENMGHRWTVSENLGNQKVHIYSKMEKVCTTEITHMKCKRIEPHRSVFHCLRL